MPQLSFGFCVSDVIEDNSQIPREIDEIRKWLLLESMPKLLDEQILIFLTAAEHDVTTAMKTIKSHYQLKKSWPDVFAARIFNSEMRRNLKALVFSNLPVHHNDAVVLYAKLRENSSEYFDFRCTVTTLTMSAEATVFNGPIKKAIFLVDGSGTSLKHVMKVKLGLLKMMSDYVQNCFPMGIAGVHIINMSLPVKLLFKMTKPFIKPEIANLIHLHSVGMDMETFYEKWIPRRCLQREYGGDLDSIEVYHQTCVRNLETLQWFFDAELLQRSQVT